MKGLDHIVIAVTDLGAAVLNYQKLGFTVTPLAKHPFGTHNQLVQLDGFFLELLAIGEPEKLPKPQTEGFSFALFNQAYLQQRQGASMLVLDSSDFNADHKLAQKAQLNTYPPFEFTRNAELPNGDVAQVSFGLNFITHNQMPLAAFFSCQQFNPEHFWKPEYQQHPNGAKSIIEVCIVADTPSLYSGFFANICHSNEISQTDGSVQISTARGNIIVVTPQVFSDRYEVVSPDISHGPVIAGLRIAVSNDKELPSKPITIYGTTVAFGHCIKK